MELWSASQVSAATHSPPRFVAGVPAHNYPSGRTPTGPYGLGGQRNGADRVSIAQLPPVAPETCWLPEAELVVSGCHPGRRGATGPRGSRCAMAVVLRRGRGVVAIASRAIRHRSIPRPRARPSVRRFGGLARRG